MANSFGTRGSVHSYGYASCKWIRNCDMSWERPGMMCNSTQSNVFLTGFCFQSDIGTLECGRLAGLDDKFGESPRSFDLSDSVAPLRCPPGSPARTLARSVCIPASDRSSLAA